MNSLFGDATSVMPTPETIAEAELLFGGQAHVGSPVPSLDINARRGHTADNAIPGLMIDPPSPHRPGLSRQGSSSRGREGEGVGGWIANMVARARRDGNGGGNGEGGSEYSRVEQRDEDDERR
jgi:hypothetical protein